MAVVKHSGSELGEQFYTTILQATFLRCHDYYFKIFSTPLGSSHMSSGEAESRRYEWKWPTAPPSVH